MSTHDDLTLDDLTSIDLTLGITHYGDVLDALLRDDAAASLT